MTTMLGLSLTGRKVVFVGGGAVAARRLPRLLDDGALVTVIAPALGAEVQALVDAGRVEWIARDVRENDLDGAWFVHSATADRGVDARVAAWCETRRIFCVNTSDGAHGSARLTAETRAGDIVVGVVSDAGVDPRRTARVRDAIGAQLAAGLFPVRRRRHTATGRVDLVGGGPGPLDLMTVRGRRLLAEADVIIADRLGPAGALPELDADVEIIDVGKRPGHHPVPQHEINELLITHARQGKRVVRLKGGDPFVYGRGGEELAACLAAGIPTEVVPGVTSAIAVPQAAGIPVTHRGVSAGLHLVNGQADISATTLAALGDDAVTTVVLMGVAALPKLAAAAQAAGVDPDRPVAIVERGHTPQQRTTRTTLGRMAQDAADAGVRNPAVVVVGEVTRTGLLMGESQLVELPLAGDVNR